MTRLLSPLTTVLLLLLLAGGPQACSQASPSGVAAADTLTAEQLQLRRDIGTMLLVGFRGTAVTDTSHIIRDIRDYHVGGVILFEYDAPSGSRPRNVASPQQLRRLCATLQQASAEPLLIGIDQEGGKVCRLKESYGFPPFVSAKQMALGGPDSVRRYARLTAQTLRSLGINLNFAPCVDVDVNPASPVIGRIERSFSSRPATVAACARIWVDEQRQAGVLSCLKHFPGHGSARGDTHQGLVDVSTTWQPAELEPYRTLFAEADIPMVMTTHVFNAGLDRLWPATLSQQTLGTLLRDSLGFAGVVITDDLAMGAMTRHYDRATMLSRAINAGADMLCLSNNGDHYDPDIVPHTIDLIVSLVDEGLIAPQRIAQSAQRIRSMKQARLRLGR